MMKSGSITIELPAGYTPTYFMQGWIGVPTIQPGLIDGGNVWTVIGPGWALAQLTEKVTAFHNSVLNG